MKYYCFNCEKYTDKLQQVDDVSDRAEKLIDYMNP